MNQKILVTGASGFVGRHCLTALHDAGFSVYAVCRCKPAVPVEGVSYLNCDLRNAEATAEIFRNVRPSYLLHLAWYVEPGKYLHSDENLDWIIISIRLARQFVECGGRRLVTVGSCADYDWTCIPKDGRLSETAPLAYAGSLYSAAKSSLGNLLGAYSKEHGLSCAHARLFYLFGPGESEKRLIPRAIRSIRKGIPFAPRNGAFVRDYLYVKDAASACACLLKSNLEGAVNIGSGEGCRLFDFLHEVEDTLGARGLVSCEYDSDSSAEPVCMIADIQKLRSVGWKPHFSIPMALRDYLNNREDEGRLKCRTGLS